jgi:hypothetical protein
VVVVQDLTTRKLLENERLGEITERIGNSAEARILTLNLINIYKK